MKSKRQNSRRPQRRCRRCGCTWTNACMTAWGACSWVEREDLCSGCLTPRERKLWFAGARRVSTPTRREVIEALRTQIQTLRRSFRDLNGTYTEPEYAIEEGAAIKIVRAS